MKRSVYIYLILLLLTGSYGCKSPSDDAGGVSYNADINVSLYNVRPLRKGENYTLWLKKKQDTVWINVGLLELPTRYPGDSTAFVFHTTIDYELDTLSEALITIERSAPPVTPTLTVMRGEILPVGKYVRATVKPDFINNFTVLSGSLIFTTQSSDTTAYKHEFYLSSYDGTKFASSLSLLPLAPNGWKYGLWAVDSTFTPDQLIFYGLFTNASGHDSDSLKDNLEFPGGDKPQAMNIASGSIIVTLEPDFYGNDVKLKGPSPFSLLTFQRSKYIQRNVNYPMSNVASRTIPSAVVTITKK